jgi:hypothetical protein
MCTSSRPAAGISFELSLAGCFAARLSHETPISPTWTSASAGLPVSHSSLSIVVRPWMLLQAAVNSWTDAARDLRPSELHAELKVNSRAVSY